MGGAGRAAQKAAIAARRPLIRPPPASPRGIVLTLNIQPSLTWRSPFAQRPGLRMGCSQLLLHEPCGPSPTGPKTTRIQGCRRATSLPPSPIRLPHHVGCPREGYAHERRRRHRRNAQARGNGVSLLLSAQPADRGLRRARHPSDSMPARTRGRRPGGRYTRIKRGKRNGVFAAQAGPGIENAFPGVAQAFSENVPLLVIPAGLPLARQYVRPVFRAADVYRPVTKWSALAHSVEELPDLMRRAYHAMRSDKGGPVLVEIPAEVWEAEYAGELDYAPVAVQRAAPDPEAVKNAGGRRPPAK